MLSRFILTASLSAVALLSGCTHTAEQLVDELESAEITTLQQLDDRLPDSKNERFEPRVVNGLREVSYSVRGRRTDLETGYLEGVPGSKAEIVQRPPRDSAPLALAFLGLPFSAAERAPQLVLGRAFWLYVYATEDGQIARWRLSAQPYWNPEGLMQWP